MTARPSGTVTFLFTDVEGSTLRWESHPEAMKLAMARHDALVREAIEAGDGVVFTTAGDAFCAAFSSPREAIGAAVAAQKALAAETWGEAPLLVRMALHTGNADERDGDYFGPPLNRCARLLSIGHGGQILVSAVTAQLIADNLGPLELQDLGPQQLKDLDRPETVFQIWHSDLQSEFPALRSESPAQDAADFLAEGRQAHARCDWQAAHKALMTATEALDLGAEDLERLGETAFWTGRSDEGIAAREKAYGAYDREGKAEAAARMALLLAETYKYRLAASVSRAWLARAERLLADAEGTVTHGHLLRWQTVCAFDSEGDPDKALLLADSVFEIGIRLGDRDLQALGLQDKGRILVSMGRIEEGLALVDEAMVAAVAGELSPMTTGRSYCNMLSVCFQVADYQRAGDWSDAALVWCESHSDSAYPGFCRMFKAQLTWIRGSWDDASAECREAISELTGFTPIVGATLHQAGEIELRAGRLEAAARDFASAHEHGFTPLPGMAELRLREGKAAEARDLMADALGPDGLGPIARARLFPTWIDIQIALGAAEETETALRELEEVA